MQHETDNCVECGDSAAHFHTLSYASEKPWDGSTSRFTDAEYQRAAAGCDGGDAPPKTRCFLPHHEPGGALNVSALHNAAARFSQLSGHNPESVARAKAHLRSHYRQLGEEVPDVLQAGASDVDAFAGKMMPDDGKMMPDGDGGKMMPDGDGNCPENHHKMPDGSCMPDDEMGDENRIRVGDGSYMTRDKFERERKWRGVLVVEGTPTGDGREFATDALDWVETPLIRWQKEGAHGGQHDVTVTVGRADRVWRQAPEVWGEGVLDLESPDGFEIYRRMKKGFAGGISIDADDISNAEVEVVWPEQPDGGDADPYALLFGKPEKIVYHGGRIRAATLVDIPAFVEAAIALSGDSTVEAVTASVAVAESCVVARHQTATTDAPWTPVKRAGIRRTLPREAYAWANDQVGLFAHHDVDGERVGAANLTACAAAIQKLASSRGIVPESDLHATYEHLASHLRDAGLVPMPLGLNVVAAADAPIFRPPSEWFANPGLSVPVGITVTDQGRVYGHAAQWGECHVGFDDICVSPPYEDTHSHFLTGEVICDDDTHVAVGQITIGTGHAPLSYRASRAVEHYDNTGTVVADVAVGNDDVGIWVAGAIRAHAEVSRVHDLRASGRVSGDWRRIGGELRLVGLLGVNVAGFPLNTQARIASGVPQSLVAAGFMSVGNVRSREEIDQNALKHVMGMLRNRVAKENS